MEYGAHAFIFTERWSDDSVPILNLAKELELDCFEIPTGDDVVFDAGKTRARAESLGLTLTVSPGGEWPEQHDISCVESQQRAAAVDWHKSQISVAGEIGAVAYTGCLYGHPGIVDRDAPAYSSYPRIAEGLAELADFGSRNGVTVVIEPMSHFRTHLVNTPRDAVKLVELAGHDNLQILIDTYHVVTEIRDYEGEIEIAGGRLWGLHACENDRGVPGGGLVPWASIGSALRRLQFDGYVLMESYNTSIEGFARSRGIFQDVCPDGAAFARNGLRFLRDTLGE